MQIDDKKYCFIYSTYSYKIFNNAKIVDCAGNTMHKFAVGNGINDVQTNGNNELWVSYADYGIYSFSSTAIEKRGLNCFDKYGKLIYAYHHSPLIDECNMLNVISDTEILINIYSGSIKSWYALGIIKNKNIKKIIEWRVPSRILAYSDNKILVMGYYLNEIKSKFKLLDIADEPMDIGTFEFYNEEKEQLNCVHAQKDQLFFWKNSLLYTASIGELEMTRKN
ncbi:MAG: hypothetical protein FWH35_00095 [Treponema sp.]|nr:hypothetical protein [Treponema sp.]